MRDAYSTAYLMIQPQQQQQQQQQQPLLAMLTARQSPPLRTQAPDADAAASSSSFYSSSYGAAAAHWRTLLDNCLVELVAALFLHLVTVLCWPAAAGDTYLQFAPAIVFGLNLLCIKDEDYFFPDCAPTVTTVIWILGGYHWQHVAARVFGQMVGVGIAMWIALAAAGVSPLEHRVEHPHTVVFALELVGTLIEHLAVVDVLLPLLPPLGVVAASAAAQKKVKPKSHPDTQPPSNSAVMHAAITFSTLHWCLWRGLSIDMSPTMTLLVAILRSQQPQNQGHVGGIWGTAVVALWGQFVGVCVCVLYAALYVPRETKFWPARHLRS